MFGSRAALVMLYPADYCPHCVEWRWHCSEGVPVPNVDGRCRLIVIKREAS